MGFGGIKNWEKQVRWRDLMAWIWRHLCVCPVIDHDQQLMKIHTKPHYCINNNPKGWQLNSPVNSQLEQIEIITVNQ